MASSIDKQTQALYWGKTAQVYVANAHEGPGIMMPLISAYVETAKTTLKGGSPKILDIASGTGEPGFSLAKAYPEGHVFITDFAEGMIAGAKERADKHAVRNASFAVADAEDLKQFEISSFDILTCNSALMAMPNYDRALLEFHRVLKPDGLLMIGVWGSPQQTQMINLMQDVRAAVAPNDSFFADPSSLCGHDKVLHALQQAGFSHISIREINVPMRLPVERLHAGMLQSAVFVELLDRLAARGDTGAAERAHTAALDIAREKGFLQEDGWVNLPTNLALFVTARP
ncbi:probable demethylmenaquinone methyltransferase at N-terminal half [Coccomyxa sp. Obi]|nr:probable demethylmenaquinone methyltransferase at N-terminal half [Coccomyxa sp. Obi]